MELSDQHPHAPQHTGVSDVAKVPTYIAVLLVTAAGLYLAALRSLAEDCGAKRRSSVGIGQRLTGR